MHENQHQTQFEGKHECWCVFVCTFFLSIQHKHGKIIYETECKQKEEEEQPHLYTL